MFLFSHRDSLLKGKFEGHPKLKEANRIHLEPSSRKPKPISKDIMAEEGNAQRDVPIPEDPPVRDIPMDVQRTREKMRTREEMITPAEWLVLFRGARPDVYDGVPHPTRLDTWILQLEQLLEAFRIPRNLWVPLATIQLDGVASIWWRDMGEDSHTTSWSSFTNELRYAFGVPPDPNVLEFDSEEAPQENPVEEGEVVNL